MTLKMHLSKHSYQGLSEYFLNYGQNETMRINKYTENKAKQNYDYDFANSNANSYELWTKRRHKIKQKKILAKTITWLLNDLIIIKRKRFWQKHMVRNTFWNLRKSDMLRNFYLTELKPRPNYLEMTSILIFRILIPNKQQIFVYRPFSCV